MDGHKLKSILIVKGAYSEIYEPAWYRALKSLGFKVKIFDSHNHIGNGFFKRIEKRLNFGPSIYFMKKKLLILIYKFRPDVCLLYQGHYFDKNFIIKLKKYSFVFGYHNDDMFGPRAHMLRYRLLNKSIPFYDGYHFYRKINVKESISFGQKNSYILKPYYIPWLDMPQKKIKKFASDVLYIGHYENDGRADYFNFIFTKNIKIVIKGEEKYWKKNLSPELLKDQSLIPVYGRDYRKYISNAKIACCFFSNWNRDSYTRRVFEITACKTFLLSERTDDMLEIFKEGIHAEYFGSKEEFYDKIRYYLLNPSKRHKIALSGYNRVRNNNNDIISRMRDWSNDVQKILDKNNRFK